MEVFSSFRDGSIDFSDFRRKCPCLGLCHVFVDCKRRIMFVGCYFFQIWFYFLINNFKIEKNVYIILDYPL